MIKYAHTGYAKAGSTWLQNYFFTTHDAIYHLGKASGSEFIDNEILLTLWIDIIEKPKFLYDAERTKNIFQQHVEKAVKQNKQACGLSHEPLTNIIRGRVDIVERAERLKDMVGEDTKILIIIREQLSWIQSLYAGLLREGGMPLTFEQFLFYFYYDQDRSPFSTLFFDKVYEMYADLFGAKNVHILPFEMMQSNLPKFVDLICQSIGVNRLTDINNHRKNVRPNPRELYALLKYNMKNRYYLGGHKFERPWSHTVRTLYEDKFRVNPPDDLSMGLKKYLYAYTEIGKNLNNNSPKLTLEFPDKFKSLLKAAYKPHNTRLQKMIDFDLTQYNYYV